METIKSVTNCPTCGSECKIEGDVTHFYVPKNKYSEEDMLRAFEAGCECEFGGAPNFKDWFKNFKK